MILPANDSFSFNARTGLSSWSSTLDKKASGNYSSGDSVTDDGLGVYFGIGAEININANVYTGLEFTKTIMNAGGGPESDPEDDYTIDVTSTSLLVGVKF